MKGSGGQRQVRLRILDKEYVVACPEEEYESLLTSADYLMHKVQDVRKGGKVVGNERIVVMAALNIAHELIQHQKNNTASALPAGVDDKLQHLHKKVDEALAKAEGL